MQKWRKSLISFQVKFFTNKKKAALRTTRQTNEPVKRLFEIGCGQGFFANYLFKDNTTELELNGFCGFGLQNFHPHFVEFLKKLDAYQHIEEATSYSL